MNQIKKIQEAFATQAKKFGDGALTIAREDYIKWMVESLPLEPRFEVLDVAAGTAHLSRAIAPYVKKVTAFDVTPEMLAEGEKEAVKAGIQNIAFKIGNAELLPFENDTFDLVVSRFAVHHFTQPSIQVAEMTRVCRPSGFVGIIDIVSPPEEGLAHRYNHWERVRDPSHTMALSPEAFAGLISRARLVPTITDSREIEVDVDSWLSLTQPGEQPIREIKLAIEQDIAGKGSTGLRPFIRDQKFKFWQTWMIAVGKKENS